MSENYDELNLLSSQTENKGTGRNGNPRRSKHSEREQQRRLKINERFQVLMDLIPQNDQKRDKASFLLEVIQYIQFLQAKVNMYEGNFRKKDMHEGWTQEPEKLVPLRNGIEPIESCIDQPQLMSNGSGHEEHYNVKPSMLLNSQISVNSEMVEALAYKMMDHSTNAANQGCVIGAVAQSNVLGNVSDQPLQSSFSDPDIQGSYFQSQFWQSRTCPTETDLSNYALTEEELRTESGEASISNVYSQRLLNNLTRALQSSGVDLMQTSISVQLDIGRRGDAEPPSTMFEAKDHQNHCRGNETREAHGVGSSYDPSDRAVKRPSTQYV